MTFHKQLRLLASSIFCLSLLPVATGQTSAPAAPAPAPAAATYSAPITENDLKIRYVGKLVFLRGAYLGDDLAFDTNGNVTGSPAVGSFTLSALQINKVNLSKKKLEIEADRYGLHFVGSMQTDADARAFDKVKISKKPVHISIDRELVVLPKVKKEKERKDASPEEQAAIAALQKNQAELLAMAPAHSAMLLSKALDSIFASDVDSKMLAKLPPYWQEYFNTQSKHQPFMPADASIRTVGEGMTAPKVLKRIDPTSNEYAQQFGIAGLAMLRTVVDANGVPQQIAIDRPIGFGLDEKAVEAVKSARFRPATLNGQPVPVVIDLVVTFRIYSEGTQPASINTSTKPEILSASVGEGSASLNR